MITVAPLAYTVQTGRITIPEPAANYFRLRKSDAVTDQARFSASATNPLLASPTGELCFVSRLPYCAGVSAAAVSTESSLPLVSSICTGKSDSNLLLPVGQFGEGKAVAAQTNFRICNKPSP